MRVQIFAPVAGGPLTQYVAYLLPPLLELVDRGYVSGVTVTLARAHHDSDFFLEYLLPFASRVDFDVIDLPLGNRIASTFAMSQALLSSIARARADFVVSVYADFGASILALRCRIPGLGTALNRVDSIGIIHHGHTSPVRGMRATLRDRIHRLTRQNSPWSETLVVNPMLYDVIARGEGGRPKHRLVPHPVERQSIVARTSARASLGLPIDGKYLVSVGRTDARKAIPELLAAFRAARLPSDVRLLLAGLLYEPHRALVETSFGDLVANGRLILIDRHLKTEEVQLAFHAADVAAVTYYPMDDLSANMLSAIAAERPVLVNAHGYGERIIGEFALGWSANVLDSTAFSLAIARAMTECTDFVPSKRTARLVEFHRPENYVETVLRRLKRRLGIDRIDVRDWDWVMAS